ncbi:MAG: YSIRK-type signal peptide-containing protein, partial [Staphylococcus xylosus]|nr:YSIRK-type signal peptide-containing protein [Staphylococcus xylosus]
MKALIGKFFELLPRFIINFFIWFFLLVKLCFKNHENLEVLYMENKRNKYSIRKFAVGASSILIGSLLFLNVETVKAAEENNQSEVDTQVQSGNHLGDDEHQNLVNDNTNTPVNDDKTQVNDEKDNQATHTSLHKDQQDTNTKVNDSTDKVDPEFNEADKVKEQDQSEVDPEFN